MIRAEVESEVRRLCEAGSLHAAATIAIQGLGPELLGFLIAITGDRAEAGDVFADVCVRLWKSLTTFRWESSLRTWAYVLARRACHTSRQARAAWGARHVPLSQVSEIDAMIVRVRTTTLANLRGEKTRAQRLRARLAPDEQILLTLRVDRELEWRDIARVLADGEAQDAAELARAAAGLRKRFERLKEKLRRLAAEEP
jgi:RNA polymerase sigma-70 factor, ECF subfamily